MGSRLRKLRRRSTLGLPTIGTAASWKEDLLSLRHLVLCLGFPAADVRSDISRSTKPGHFLPSVIITAGDIEHACTLADVPGAQHVAHGAWSAFIAALPRSPDGRTFQAEPFLAIFHASLVADPDIARTLCEGLTAAGITIPGFQATVPAPPAPVGA